ncbi:hypothetical protein EMCRGX_G018098 [Ephydatia muelleri]
MNVTLIRAQLLADTTEDAGSILKTLKSIQKTMKMNTSDWYNASKGLEEVEVGNNLTPSHSKTRPADILIPNWVMGRTAALDVSVTSPLNPQTLLEAGVTATAAALTTEERKHDENDPKCSELGWVCIPVVAESYGAWGREATLLFSTIASRIATLSNKPKSVTLIDIYGRLNLQLLRANATSILARLMPPSY